MSGQQPACSVALVLQRASQQDTLKAGVHASVVKLSRVLCACECAPQVWHRRIRGGGNAFFQRRDSSNQSFISSLLRCVAHDAYGQVPASECAGSGPQKFGFLF